MSLPDTLKRIAAFYEPGLVEKIKATDRKTWIQLIELEDKINVAILKNKIFEADRLLNEYEAKWKAAHERQGSMFVDR